MQTQTEWSFASNPSSTEQSSKHYQGELPWFANTMADEKAASLSLIKNFKFDRLLNQGKYLLSSKADPMSNRM
jgi:hypothetical protein